MMDWKHLLDEGWKFATGGGAGFVIGKLTDFRNWRRDRRIQSYGEIQAKEYRGHMDKWQAFGGSESTNSFQRLSAARGCLEAAVTAFRKVGDEPQALELEKEAKGWDRLEKAQATAPDPAIEENKARLRLHAEHEANEARGLLREWEDHGVLGPDAETYWARASHGFDAAEKALRQAGDEVEALKVEKESRTHPLLAKFTSRAVIESKRADVASRIGMHSNNIFNIEAQMHAIGITPERMKDLFGLLAENSEKLAHAHREMGDRRKASDCQAKADTYRKTLVSDH
jgi:hypothetical protein